MGAQPTCRSCGADIRWGVTTSTGARVPIDPKPHPLGNVYVTPDGRFRILTREETDRGRKAGHPLYRVHHASCPSVERHRGVSRDQLAITATVEDEPAAGHGPPFSVGDKIETLGPAEHGDRRPDRATVVEVDETAGLYRLQGERLVAPVLLFSAAGMWRRVP